MKIRLKELLEEKCIRPEKFAKMMDCTLATVYNIMSEKTSASVRQIKKMAVLLGVNEWELLYSKEELMYEVEALKKKDKTLSICQCPKCGAFLRLTAVSPSKQLGNN